MGLRTHDLEPHRVLARLQHILIHQDRFEIQRQGRLHGVGSVEIRVAPVKLCKSCGKMESLVEILERVIQALDPDIVCLQEISSFSAAQTAALLTSLIAMAPLLAWAPNFPHRPEKYGR